MKRHHKILVAVITLVLILLLAVIYGM